MTIGRKFPASAALAAAVRTLRRSLLAASATLAIAAPAAPAAGGYFDVEKLPPPPLTGQQMANDVEAFSTTYAPRVTGTPGEQAAAEFLRAEAASLGYDARIVTLPVAGPDPTGTLRAVVATRKGLTKPGEHILFMGHYDTVAGFGGATLEGAYDNGAGTTMIRSLAKSLANVPTNRSVTFIYYNGEEEGLLTSQRHAAAWEAEGTPVRAVLGFDMTGIAYPVADPGPRNCLCMWHGDEDEELEPLLRHINFNVLGFPDVENLVNVVGVNARNSDESSWDRLGYKSMRWAGMRAASDYPAYHMPDDNMATIERVAGGRQFFEQGLRNTLLSSYLTALALDSEMPVARATASGNGTVTFDASGSGDPDGTPSSLRWEFGDGATGEGVLVTHKYARKGQYLAKLTVGDNLFPQVTATATVPVEVTKAPGAKKKAKKKAKKRKASSKKRKKGAKKRKRARRG